MLTLKQIAKAINDKLAAVLPNVPVQSKDISEGYERPGLFVDFESTTAAQYGARGKERTIQVIIYYFPSDRYKYKIEMLEVQEILEDAFTGHFAITDNFVVYPFEVNSVKVDGVLQFSFEIYYIELDDRADADKPDMLHLHSNLKLGDD